MYMSAVKCLQQPIEGGSRCRSKLSIPRQERICNKCRKRIIGDEFNFLFECDDGIEKLRISIIQKIL